MTNKIGRSLHCHQIRTSALRRRCRAWCLCLLISRFIPNQFRSFQSLQNKKGPTKNIWQINGQENILIQNLCHFGVQIILVMIRLINLKPQDSQQRSKSKLHSMSFIQVPKSQSGSAVKLGRRRSRLHTIKVTKCQELDKSFKMTQTESFETSYQENSPEAKSKNNLLSSEEKDQKPNLQIRSQMCVQNDTQSVSGSIFKSFFQLLRQQSTKGERNTQKKREIVKLKHPKRKSYSPIDKLVHLLDQQETQVRIQMRQPSNS